MLKSTAAESTVAKMQNTAPPLKTLASRVPARATLSKLPLSARQSGALRKVIKDLTSRKSGNVILWGDGETALRARAAQAVGRELQRPLYRVDLGKVVSKYIGETEKNIERLLAAAEAANAILFFDEADALFGKRTGVKDSHDRYANLETNYLLDRIQNYSVVVIFSANKKNAIDPVFLRRMRFIVDFTSDSTKQIEKMPRETIGKN